MIEQNKTEGSDVRRSSVALEAGSGRSTGRSEKNNGGHGGKEKKRKRERTFTSGSLSFTSWEVERQRVQKYDPLRKKRKKRGKQSTLAIGGKPKTRGGGVTLIERRAGERRHPCT